MHVYTQRSNAGSQRGAPRGQMMIFFALTLTVFVGAMMIGVDLSRLRAEAENAQHAANSAALAGVVFLPDFTANAISRAQMQAKENGFVSGLGGVTVAAVPTPNYNDRLTVTITEPVSLFFGGVFGLNRKTITRSATAEYYQPLQTGAPDNVLGYAPFPTTIVSPTVSEGFYLENKGPYTFKESGDAYSPVFESYNRFKFAVPTDISGVANPCVGEPTCTQGGVSTTPNQDHVKTNPSFNGYNYVVDDPLTNTLVIKLFDPFYEPDYDAAAQSWDSAHHTAFAPTDSTSSALLGMDSTKDAAGHCITPVGNNCTKMIDQPSDGGNPFTPSGSANPTTLEFSLHSPTTSAYDTNSPLITTTASYTNATAMTQCVSGGVNCVWQGPPGTSSNVFDAGGDPTACTSGGCTASPYAFHFVNYAVIHGPGIFHLNVRSVVDPFTGKNGTGGNAYGIAVCGINAGDPVTSTTRGPGLGGTSDPYTNASTPAGWNAASCINPNDPTNGGACAHPSKPAPADQCIHLYGLGKMAIHNWLSAGQSLIPLGYIPPAYGGRTLQIRLYDIGDVSGTGNSIAVLTPAGNLDASGHVTSTAPYPAWLDASYTASPADGSGVENQSSPAPYRIISSPQSLPAGATINVDNAYFNGSWLTTNVPLTLPGGQAYRDMVAANGGYWKVLYNIPGGANDATTWEITVAGSPVHLVSG